MQDNGLSVRVKDVFFHYDISAEEMERATGVASNTFRNLMSGKTQKIYITTIMALLDKFPQVSTEWLLYGRGKMIKGTKEEGACLECITKEGEIKALKSYNQLLMEKVEAQAVELGKVKEQLFNLKGNNLDVVWRKHDLS